MEISRCGLLRSSRCLIFCTVFFSLQTALGFNFTMHGSVSGLRLARIQRHLEKINKPAHVLTTIKSEDGDVIDCVRRHKQPAMDHPLLRNHKIHMFPERPRFNGSRNSSWSEEMKGAWQTWHKSGHCPKGTIPIRRTSVDDVLRAKSLFHFGKKTRPYRFREEPPDVVSSNGHEHAIAYTGSQEFYGAKATMNVWDPSIQVVNEFSLSQIWVLSGSFEGSELNSIEAGWQVSPELYGDNRPRLFTYWTSDAYEATGCYNLLCSGFVQTNNKIAIGAAISPVSSYGGSQYDITILIWKDPKQGNWWLGFGDDTLVGYWPAELFTHLADHAEMVEWGGEIVNTRTNGGHTSTQMGSGHFAESGFGRASYFRNLETVDSDNSLSSVYSLSALAEDTNCYNIRSSSSPQWGTYFYFGGPGSNPNCP
ncbi:uncharacterized protein LOC18426005 [Amborella trichopoda]|uniref:Neprosin PEP catalytic domain-containing protein n=1 Tax=Amborella trichopoda TaxID=13333 RepID=W1NQG0_AMBTC|nr:uncharacterized protein LOC18426005 [Amborella trichopoda]ERM98017.1 hypothetical protein AMTR_s00120p00051630 [Amborella trichopoda]|eukprot:XP_020517924.1 uncharacterized protein LOC18426005 [Amborella trichopoda]